MTVRVASDKAIKRAVIRRPEVKTGINRVAEAVVTTAKRNANATARDTGAYVNSMGVRHQGDKTYASANIEYAAAVEGGTGIYGCKHKLIRVKPGKRVLINGVPNSAKTLKGMQGEHIMENAAQAVAGSSAALDYDRVSCGRWVTNPAINPAGPPTRRRERSGVRDLRTGRFTRGTRGVQPR